MKITAQLASHFKQVHYGGNWTWVNLKDTLADISWQQATAKIQSFNTIAVLVYHINYYAKVQLEVMAGNPLIGSDKLSFDCPPIESAEDWQQLLTRFWSEADAWISTVQQMPDSRLDENFAGEKYGSWHRNLLGIIEHTHYHLGQIVLLKKMLTPGT